MIKLTSSDMLDYLYDQPFGERLFVALFECLMGGSVEWCEARQCYIWKKGV